MREIFSEHLKRADKTKQHNKSNTTNRATSSVVMCWFKNCPARTGKNGDHAQFAGPQCTHTHHINMQCYCIFSVCVSLSRGRRVDGAHLLPPDKFKWLLALVLNC